MRCVGWNTSLGGGVSVRPASLHGSDVTTAMLSAFGPITGLAPYLLGYLRVLSPSIDSPTRLVFRIRAAGFVSVGITAVSSVTWYAE